MGDKSRTETGILIASSAISAIVSTTATAPVTRIIALWQCQGEILRTGRLAEPYKGVIGCVRYTYRTEGLLPFWRGNTAACQHKVTSNFLNFGLKDAIRKQLIPHNTDYGPQLFAKNLLAGGLAGFVSLGLLYPLDYTHIRLANDVKVINANGSDRQFKGIVDVFRKTWQCDGVAGLYRGFCVSLLGVMVYRGLYFGLYDTFRSGMPRERRNILKEVVLGYSVTLVAGLLAYPLSTVRRRMLMRSCEAEKYRGWWDCATTIVRTEGARALMRGALINMLFVVPGGLLLVAYDSFRRGH